MGGASGRILEVAAERFAENGYRGTSIEDIAAGAEISRSSLFWHFGSKEGLLRAVIEETLGSWTEGIAEAGQERGLAGLRAAVSALNRLHVDNPPMVRLLTLLLSEASATEPGLVPIFAGIEQSMLGLWTRFLTEAAEDGELIPGLDPATAASVVNAATFGSKQLWALNPESHGVAAMEAALLHVVECLSVRSQNGLSTTTGRSRRVRS
jgi:AcrR family transcriptional regulator